MPEFVMDTGGIVLSADANPAYAGFKSDGAWTFHALDEFTRGYIEALFFTECDPSINAADVKPGHEFLDGSIPADVGFSDLAPETLARIITDCSGFQVDNATALAAAVHAGRPMDHLGHDFWLTRCGHGAGFWDRKELEPAGEEWDATCERLRAAADGFSDARDPAQSAAYSAALGDRERLKADSLGMRLSAAAEAAGNVDAYFGDDGRVYLS